MARLVKNALAIVLGIGLLLAMACDSIEFEFDDDDTVGDDDDDVVPDSNWSWGQVNTSADADASLVGEDLDDTAGAELRVTGDMTGDGLVDLAVGTAHHDAVVQGGGKIYFVHGRQSGWQLGEPLADHPSVVGTLEDMGLDEADPLGDVNGDGLADVALDPEADLGPPEGNQYVLFGRTTGWVSSMPVSSSDGSLENANANGSSDLSSHAYLGDFDGDGLDDWLVSGPFISDGEGHVVSGADIAPGMQVPDDAVSWLHGPAMDFNEMAFKPGGDLNGDGLDDIIGYPRSTYTAVLLLHGRSTGIPHDAAMTDETDCRIVHPLGSSMGSVVIGDVNGDGIDDLAISVNYPFNDPQTGLFIFFGRTTWPDALDTDSADVHVAPGYPVALGMPVGDLDGDGIDDLVFEGPDADVDPDDVTDVYMLAGRTSWTSRIELADVDVRFEPSTGFREIWNYKHFEHLSGDIDGDGITDLLLHHPYADHDGEVECGKVLVFVGRESWAPHLTTDDADVIFAGTERWESFGSDNRTQVGDFNGDGYDDLAISSTAKPVGTCEGETFIFFGQPR